MNHFRILLGLISLLVLSGSLPAQTEAESNTLVIESQQGDQHHTLKVGDRLNYQMKGGEMSRGGKVESVADGSVTVGGKEIAFSDLETVIHVKGHKHARGSRLLKTSLIGMVITSLLFLLTVVLWRGSSTAGQRGMILFFALLAFVLFPVLLLIALIELAMSHKKFDLGGKWRLRKG